MSVVETARLRATDEHEHEDVTGVVSARVAGVRVLDVPGLSRSVKTDEHEHKDVTGVISTRGRGNGSVLTGFL